MANLRVDKITSTETFETTGSVQFDGTGDYLSIPNSNDFAFGTGDFTIEMWLYASSSGSYQTPIDFRPTATNGNYPALIRDTDGDLYYFVNSSRLIDNVSISNHVWYHVAICREGTTTRLYLDGVLKGSASDSTNYITDDINISSYKTGGNYFHGYISNLRVIKGKALYTENFKVPMRELENIPGTVILACQSKTNTILEKTGKTITANGNAIANELTPGLLTPVLKNGGSSAIKGSVEFDGTGDYLTVPNTEDLRLADSDFTIEFWATTSKTDSSYTAFSLFENSSAIRSYILEVRNNGAVRFEWWYNGSSSNNITTGTGAVIVNEWYHYAVSRNGATLKLFINGVEVGSTNVGTNSLYNNTVTPFMIGGMFQSGAHTQKWQGNISNLRVVKGTALYTEEFIPPTRELKKVPGTVLLCCQDPDSPLTEAIGKTITGYGSLQQDSPELVTDGEFESASNWSSAESDWTVGSGQAVINSSNSGYDYLGQLATGLLNGEQYELVFNVTNYSTGRLELSQSSSGNMGVESPNGRNVFRFTYTGTTGGAVGLYSYTANTASFTLTNVSLKRVFASKSGSNFTPQVGDDRKVTFEGVTKINSDAYFYLPTGDTVSRETTGTYNAGTRGIFGGGFVGPGGADQRDTIQFINIASTGNATDAGDLTQARYGNAALASATRALWAGGLNPTPTYFNTIDAVEIMSKGDAFDFGDLYHNVYYPGGVSNRTRGIYAGGYKFPSPSGFRSEIGYITISSKGDTQDFGTLTLAKNSYSTFGSPTRGCFAGGATPGRTNSIEYVTIATTGNSQDFGDLTVARNFGGGCGSAIRGLVGGGSSPSSVNTIDYVTIATTGTAADFGDLTAARYEIGSCSSSTRGCFAGAWAPLKVNTIDYVSIQTTGNAQLFGELVNIGVMQEMGTSNGHGGLG